MAATGMKISAEGLEEATKAVKKLSFQRELRWVALGLDEKKTAFVVVDTAPNTVGFDQLKEKISGTGEWATTPRLILYNHEWITADDIKKDKIVYISWIPDATKPMRDKMLYSGSKEEVVKQVVSGGYVQIHAGTSDSLTLEVIQSKCQ